MMKKAYVFFGLVLSFLFFAGLGALLFTPQGVDKGFFQASDANVGWLSEVQGKLKAGDGGTFWSSPLVGGAGVRSFVLSEQLLRGVSPVVYNNYIYAFCMTGASLFLLLFLRLIGLSMFPAAIGALIAIWLGSATLAAAGHIGKFGVAFFGCAALWLIELGVQSGGWRRVCWSVLAGGAVGAMLLEQQDVGLLWGLLLAAYALFRAVSCFGKQEIKGYVALLVPIALIGLMMAGGTALRAYEQNVSGVVQQQRGTGSAAEEKWHFITQWSLPPAELMDLVAPGFMGWKTGDQVAPYWGEVGQSEEWKKTGRGMRNFRLDSVYVGIIPFFLMLYAFLYGGDHRRWVIFFGGLGLVFLLLAFGKYSWLYRMFYALPLVNNIRAPIKFMQLFQICVGVISAVGVAALWRDGQEHKHPLFLKICGSVSLLFLLSALVVQLGFNGWVESFAQRGWGASSGLIAARMRDAFMHAGLLGGGFSLVCYLTQKRAFFRQGFLFLVLAMLVGDVWFLSRQYYSFESVRAFESPDAVLDFLEGEVGDERLYLIDSSGMHNYWLGLAFKMRGIAHFNIFQMPRMPSDYEAWLGMIQNPLRLMELSSVQYVSLPLQVWKQVESQQELQSMFSLIFYYGFRQLQPGVVVSVQCQQRESSHVLAQFTGSLPRLAVLHDWRVLVDEAVGGQLKLPAFKVKSEVLVAASSAEDMPVDGFSEGGWREVSDILIDRSEAAGRVLLEKPGVVLFSQRYQPNWRVFVDGLECPLLRCNFLMMGVWVDAGSHEVSFVYEEERSDKRLLAVASVLMLGALVFLVVGQFGRGRVA